jgi:hypothetical protein
MYEYVNKQRGAKELTAQQPNELEQVERSDEWYCLNEKNGESRLTCTNKQLKLVGRREGVGMIVQVLVCNEQADSKVKSIKHSICYMERKGG